MPLPVPLLLVPGLLCSARLYAPQVAALWPRGPVMVADHLRDADVTAIAARILAHAPPRFALAGLSMGGYIAFAMMRQAPERIVKLALLDTSARPDTPEQSAVREKFIAMAEAGRLSEVVDTLAPRLVHKSRHGDAALVRVIRDMADDTGVTAFVQQERAIITRPDSRPLLASIACATLVLVGEGDELTPPALAQEMAAGIGGSRLVVVPGSGHLSTLEQPDAVNAALGEWLDQ
ncbi:alpha/beta fold hydrolase [Pseudolabrys taiwanensis]|uniref:Alpha/beta fold hydrolase n=1 Tax=Pseudolabrys taiwanensis TaxID=331696 RepID=A0A345ZTY9_9HYPH|nr:alpha/beta fold hydrolase [Pseudolabrys taiwanensis]AXK80386.1 alpha/beta fold hydrolase [Pseudolabrys taiwanensis]